MADTRRVGSLEVAEDLEFQKRAWTVQRAGWVIMALIVLLGLAGLFGGSGPLSRTQAGSEDVGVQVEYDRFERVLSPSSLQVQLGRPAVTDGQVRLKVTYAYLDKVEMQHIEPQPESVSAAPDGLVYAFSVEDPAEPGTIYFHFEPQRIGMHSGGIGPAEGELLQVSHFVYP